MDGLSKTKDGSVDFNRRWSDYERGFGNLGGDYWLGLASLHQILKLNGANELRIDLKDYSGNSAYAKYSSFNVGDSNSKYTLSVSGYSGTAGDAIAASRSSAENVNGMKFSTKIKTMMREVFTVLLSGKVVGGLTTVIVTP